jgi:tRNA (Thr-GGU) A37 N-methylase
MNVEQIPIYDIKPYENNAKKHTDAQIEEIH